MGHRDLKNDYNRGSSFLLIDLIFGIVSFGVTLAFKIVELVFSMIFGLISGINTSGSREARHDRAETSGSGSPRRDEAASEIKKTGQKSSGKENVREFRKAGAPKSESEKSVPKRDFSADKHSDKVNEARDKDIYVVLFIMTVIPAMVSLAAGKPLYAGFIALGGSALLAITAAIKGIAAKAGKKAEKDNTEDTDSDKAEDNIEKLIKEAFEKLFGIRKDISKLEDVEVKNRIEAICTTAEKIIGEVRTNPESLAGVRKFFYYYLDAFADIVKKYLRLVNFEESSEEVAKLVEETEKSFNDIEGIFRELCEKLVEKDMLHLKAELNVIKNSN